MMHFVIAEGLKSIQQNLNRLDGSCTARVIHGIIAIGDGSREALNRTARTERHRAVWHNANEANASLGASHLFTESMTANSGENSEGHRRKP